MTDTDMRQFALQVAAALGDGWEPLPEGYPHAGFITRPGLGILRFCRGRSGRTAISLRIRRHDGDRTVAAGTSAPGPGPAARRAARLLREAAGDWELQLERAQRDAAGAAERNRSVRLLAALGGQKDAQGSAATAVVRFPALPFGTVAYAHGWGETDLRLTGLTPEQAHAAVRAVLEHQP